MGGKAEMRRVWEVADSRLHSGEMGGVSARGWQRMSFCVSKRGNELPSIAPHEVDERNEQKTLPTHRVVSAWAVWKISMLLAQCGIAEDLSV